MGEHRTELEENALAIMADGKGILAADESNATMGKRLAGIGVENTEENRRGFRELLFKTESAEQFISGVILYDETIRQSTADGTPFPKLMQELGVIPGMIPRRVRSSANGVPSAEAWRSVSS